MRSTDYNRFQEKMRKGTEQMFYWGWNADYPDPENFLFLFYGPQGKVKYQRRERVQLRESGVRPPVRAHARHGRTARSGRHVIDQMVEILRRDAPWVWGLHPKDYALAHQWVYNRKPNKMANNSLKYQRVDPALRESLRDGVEPAGRLAARWSALVVLLLAILPAVIVYRRRERAGALGPAQGAA